jgi:hypothetical protein
MSGALSRSRKKGSRNLLSAFEDVAEQKIKVKIEGEVRKVTRIMYVLWVNYTPITSQPENPLG